MDPGARLSPSFYRVRRGDCLWNIAGKICKDPLKWSVLYDDNRGFIKNPALIFPGQELRLPAPFLPKGIYWNFGSLDYLHTASDPYPIFESSVYLLVDGKPETTAVVTLTLPSHRSIPVPYRKFVWSEGVTFADYETGNLVKSCRYRPGGITYSPDGSVIRWSSEGTDDWVGIWGAKQGF